MTPQDERDCHWMHVAIGQAQAARALGEVPVGAVVVCGDRLIAEGHNAPVTSHDPSAHAEMQALRAAAQQLGNYRLHDCEMFVTLEPCTMCAGAMLHARLKRVVFGAPDPKTGAAGSVLDVFAQAQLNHQTVLRGGVLQAECATLLRSFFSHQRAAQRRERLQTGRVLRADALRTPDVCFVALPGQPESSHYVSDLPSLDGLRLHYVDAGPSDASDIRLCLHGVSDWSYVWHPLLTQAPALGQRVICPDLIGFGKSDKPKKASFHHLSWHAKVLAELLDRLDVNNVTLMYPSDQLALAQMVLTHSPQRVAHLCLAQPQALSPAAQAAPYPDAGHRAALRAFCSTITRSQDMHATRKP